MAARRPYRSPDVDAASARADALISRSFIALVRALISEVRGLSQTGGVIDDTPENRRAIREAIAGLPGMLSSSGLSGVSDEYVDELKGLTNAIRDELFGSGEFNADSIETLESLASSQVNQLLSAINGAQLEIEQLLISTTSGVSTLADVTTQLESRLSLKKDQAVTLVNDSMKNFHTVARTEYYGKDRWYLYDNPQDGRTRDFCSAFAGTRVTLEILNRHSDAFGRKHPLPPSVSLGGYNCRAQLVPLVLDIEKYQIGPKL